MCVWSCTPGSSLLVCLKPSVNLIHLNYFVFRGLRVAQGCMRANHFFRCMYVTKIDFFPFSKSSPTILFYILHNERGHQYLSNGEGPMSIDVFGHVFWAQISPKMNSLSFFAKTMPTIFLYFAKR